MIINWLVTGDLHGEVQRFKPNQFSSDTGIIILGDAGCNFFQDERDEIRKEYLNNCGPIFYLVRGNHDMRPEHLPNICQEYDEEVDGEVMYEEAFSNIRYLEDGGIYDFDNHRALVLGGAYSVDKNYRIRINAPWFEDEMLSAQEMYNILCTVEGQTFDIVLSHTCPLDWEPTDLFNNPHLRAVDKSVEKWLNIIKDNIFWNIWLFGHYHQNRLERPNVEMLFDSIESLADIWKRYLDNTMIKDILKSPNYDKEDC